jgi:hypothetical protein
VVFVAKFQEFPAGKLGPVVGDDGIWHFEPVDDVSEEQHGLLYPEVCDWAHFDPFRELVYGDQQVSVSPGHLSQGPDDVQPPHDERPCDGNHLEGVSWKISLAGVELAPFTDTYNLLASATAVGQ